jgi:hypothetical protein
VALAEIGSSCEYAPAALRFNPNSAATIKLTHYPAIAALERAIHDGFGELVGSLGRWGACRSFIIFPPILGMFGGPLGGSFFGSEPLDYFRLAIRPHNINHPAKPWIFSCHENGTVFGHPANMRRWRPGSRQLSCHNQTDPLPCHRRLEMRYPWNDAQPIGIVRPWIGLTICGTKR